MGKADELRHALQELVRETHLESGVLVYALHESAREPGSFLMYENYESQQAFDMHLAGAALQHFLTFVPQLVDGEVEISPYKLVPQAG
jgi:quinol monooxygenase YgiN